MATHYDDEAQVDQLKAWWKENWLALVGGLGLGLGAIFGWQGYQHMSESRMTGAAQLYNDLNKATQDDRADAVSETRNLLVAEFSGTPYAALAQLQAAKAAVARGDHAAAREALDWVVSQGSDPGLQALARLRRARVDLQLGDADAALAALAEPPAGFEGLYLELRGDVLLVQGDQDGARQAYDAALAALAADAPYRDLLTRKRNDLNMADAS